MKIGALAVDFDGCLVRIVDIDPDPEEYRPYMARALICRCGICTMVDAIEAEADAYNRYRPEQLTPYEIVIDELPI